MNPKFHDALKGLMFDDPEEYAATVLRAQQITGVPVDADFDEATLGLRAAGFDGAVERFLDDDAIARCRIVIVTERGRIMLPLNHPREWHDRLRQHGLA